jgi:selenocysteine lyase/cysteine desulfurase
MILANRGYEVRRVDPKTGELTVDRFAEHVDGGTVVVASSLVQSSTGYRIDAVALAAVAHEVGARLVLDGSQGLGAVAFDVGKGVDAVFGCDQKFLLGTRGLGYLWVRDDWLESFRPLFPGWKAADDPLTSFYGPKMKLSDSASRLDHAVSWFNALANRESLGILAEVGMQEIAAHTAGLASVLRSRLEDIGLRPLPTGPLPSPILTIPVPHAEATRARLAESSIRAAVRAGRLRVSLHLYNTAEDIETLVAALR